MIDVDHRHEHHVCLASLRTGKLTGDPARMRASIVALAANAAQTPRDKAEILRDVLSALGLSPDATPEEVHTAIDCVLAGLSEGAAATTMRALGLRPDLWLPAKYAPKSAPAPRDALVRSYAPIALSARVAGCGCGHQKPSCRYPGTGCGHNCQSNLHR